MPSGVERGRAVLFSGWPTHEPDLTDLVLRGCAPIGLSDLPKKNPQVQLDRKAIKDISLQIGIS